MKFSIPTGTGRICLLLRKNCNCGCPPDIRSTLTEAERKEAALFEAERMALLQVPRTAKVIMIDRYTVEKGGKLYGVCTVTTEENIGYTKEIT